MTSLLQFGVLGIGTGAVYALLGLGLVAIYRGSGVLNLAHGSMAMVGAFVYTDLTTIYGWDVVPAVVLSVILTAVVGVLVYFLVIRPLRKASTLAQVIGTLGVFVTLQAAASLRWGSEVRLIDPILQQQNVELGDIAVGADKLVLLGIAVALTALLWALFHFTLPGLATTATSGNRRSAAALGWSEDLLATGVWTLGSALAGMAGILVAPLTGVQVDTMGLLVVAALAAALLGGLTSFPVTLAAAVVVGVAQVEIGNLWDRTGAADSLPFLVIVLYLTLRGRSLPLRGTVQQRFADLGSGRIRPAVLVATIVIVTALLLFVVPLSLADAVTATIAIATVLLSIVVLTGYTGQLSLAQYALGGLGAIIAAHLVVAGWPFEVAFLVGVVAVVPIGLVFGLSALRTRGLLLAVVTLGLGSAVFAFVFNYSPWAGGELGTQVGPQTVFGIDIDAISYPERYAVFALLIFTGCALGVANLRRGRAGRRLIAVRSNERAATALGVNVYAAKLYAFALAAALAAVGGILLGFRFHSVTYADTFTPSQSILAVAFTVVGGIGYVTGALLGSAGLAAGGLSAWIMRELLGGTGIDSYLPLATGVFLVLLLVQDPNGMVSANVAFARRLMKRVRPDKPTPVWPLPEVEKSAPVEPATLELNDLGVRFGGVVALDGASLRVSSGEVVGLIGPNGAGKTTLIDAVTGFVRSSGSIVLNGRRIDGWPAYRRARAGVSRSFQGVELFDDLTVRENLRAALDERDFSAYLTDLIAPRQRPLPAHAVAAIREFGLEEHLEKKPTDLAFGQRRLVAIARAIASAPSILLLDEPAAGLSATEVTELADVVCRLAGEWGFGILVIEHDMNFVMSVCDRIVVLDFGRKIAEGAPSEIQHDPVVIAAYLGEDADDMSDGQHDTERDAHLEGGRPVLPMGPGTRSGAQ